MFFISTHSHNATNPQRQLQLRREPSPLALNASKILEFYRVPGPFLFLLSEESAPQWAIPRALIAVFRFLLPSRPLLRLFVDLIHLFVCLCVDVCGYFRLPPPRLGRCPRCSRKNRKIPPGSCSFPRGGEGGCTQIIKDTLPGKLQASYGMP